MSPSEDLNFSLFLWDIAWIVWEFCWKKRLHMWKGETRAQTGSEPCCIHTVISCYIEKKQNTLPSMLSSLCVIFSWEESVLFVFVSLFPSRVPGTVLLWYNFLLNVFFWRDYVAPHLCVPWLWIFCRELRLCAGNFRDDRVCLAVTEEQVHESRAFFFFF